MRVRFFLKRPSIYLAVFTTPRLLIGPPLLGGYNPWNFTLTVFFEGILLLIFGGCLGTSAVEGYATMRYGVTPAVTRDTRQRLPDRRSEQTRSVLMFPTAGGLILAIPLHLLTLALIIPLG
jgi:hypothetical protein